MVNRVTFLEQGLGFREDLGWSTNLTSEKTLIVFAVYFNAYLIGRKKKKTNARTSTWSISDIPALDETEGLFKLEQGLANNGCRVSLAHHLFLPIKLYWHATTPIH